MRYGQRQYAPDAAEGGGTNPPEGGGATETPEQKAEAAELQTLLGNATPTDAEKARLEVLKGKYDVVPKGPDGKPLTEDQVKAFKEIETKFNAILAKDEKDRTPEEVKFLEDNTEDEQSNKSVYEQVDELRGEKLDVDYGDVDPLTPQGVLLREEAVENKAKASAEAEIRARFPRAYALMLHLENGGKEEDFFKPENQDFSKLTVTESDKAGQENILRTALQLKGNSPAIINATMIAIKDGGQLFEMAKAELEALQQSQKHRETQLATRARETRAREMQDMGKLASDLQTAVEKGFDGVVVPVKDRKDFVKFIGDKINYENGNFFVVNKLEPKELTKALKVAYFDFKGGDLAGLAERTAKTLNAKKLKQSITMSVVPKGTGAPVKRNVPLSQL